MTMRSKVCVSALTITSVMVGYFFSTKLDGENYFPEHKSDDDDDEQYTKIILPREKLILENKADYSKKSDIGSRSVVVSTAVSESISDVDLNVITTDKRVVDKKETSSDTYEKSVIVSHGDSFISLAKKNAVSSSDMTDILYRSGINQSKFVLQSGSILTFTFKDKTFESISIDTGGATYSLIKRVSKGKFKLTVVDFPITHTTTKKTFNITTSLSKDGLANGLSFSEISQIQDALKHKVDFSTLPINSNISVVRLSSFANGKEQDSLIQFVELNINKNKVQSYYFKDDNDAGYYDANGFSLVPSFIRHPIKNPLITSKFNLRRKHPILNVVRPHWGTDYGHIKGTPILAISDATVKFAGNRGGFGQAVILSHPNRIETLSAHMSKFGKNIKTGAKVKKGQIIGYVGKTGLSTGYHLHFELRKNNKRVNSLTVELPITDKVTNKEKFRETVKHLNNLMHLS